MLKFILLSALIFAGCSHGAKRDPAHNGEHNGPEKVLSAEGLFMKGKFMTKKRLPTHEDHYGEELDLSVRRPVVNVTNSLLSKKFAVNGTSLYANFFYNGKFWIARIPAGGVKNLYFELVHFPPEFIAAHSMLRFEMMEQSPVQLVAEMPSVETVESANFSWESIQALKEPVKIFNFVMSAEAQWTKEDKKKQYNLVRGNRSAFIQVIRFAASEDRFREFYANGSPVTQIKLDNYGSASVLPQALERSEKDGLSKIYSTWGYNCTTIAFDIYEEATGKKDSRIGFIRKGLDRKIPVFSPIKLDRYGGEEVSFMHEDPSLFEESRAAFLSLDKPGRPVCAKGVKKDNCSNIQEALKLIGK
jgi:hypothetical protein